MTKPRGRFTRQFPQPYRYDAETQTNPITGWTATGRAIRAYRSWYFRRCAALRYGVGMYMQQWVMAVSELPLARVTRVRSLHPRRVRFRHRPKLSPALRFADERGAVCYFEDTAEWSVGGVRLYRPWRPAMPENRHEYVYFCRFYICSYEVPDV